MWADFGVAPSRARRLGVALLVVVTPIGLPVAGALAEEPGSGTAPSFVAPAMTLSMTKITNGTRVCVAGTSPALGTFLVTINGTRSDGSDISYNNGSATTSFQHCVGIGKSSQPTGAFSVSFIFEGGANASYLVRPHALGGITIWGVTGDDTHIQTT